VVKSSEKESVGVRAKPTLRPRRERVGRRTGEAHTRSGEKVGRTACRWSEHRVECDRESNGAQEEHMPSRMRERAPGFDNSQHNNLRFFVRIFDRGFLGDERCFRYVDFGICIGTSHGHSFAASAGFCRCRVCIPIRARVIRV
jgi:hypothetical protein